MKERARKLREAAARAKALMGPLGTHLDSVVTSATTKDLWSGQFATDSTTSLTGDQKSLRGLAEDLRISAAAWLKEAENLETAASAATTTPGPK
jgi:hypothetical protein